jgi:hypothetical protein
MLTYCLQHHRCIDCFLIDPAVVDLGLEESVIFHLQADRGSRKMIDRMRKVGLSIVFSSLVPIVLVMSTVLQCLGRQRFLRTVAEEVVSLLVGGRTGPPAAAVLLALAVSSGR